MSEDEIARVVVDAAYKVHTRLGPGLLESVYETVLSCELVRRGLAVARQVPVAIRYLDLELEGGFKADLLVEDKVMVEIKSVEALAAVHKKQLLTYLRLSDRRVGLLINFNVVLIKEGIFRIANRFEEGGK